MWTELIRQTLTNNGLSGSMANDRIRATEGKQKGPAHRRAYSSWGDLRSGHPRRTANYANSFDTGSAFTSSRGWFRWL